MALAESGLFDTVLGLPQHPLVVHAVVVLLPLAALVEIAVALQPRWNRAWGLWVWLGLLAVGFVTFWAKESGEAFAVRRGQKAITESGHLDLGSTLPVFAGALTLLAILLWWLDRRTGRNGVRTTMTKIVALVTILAAVVTVVQVVRVGHSGATAVWG